MGIEAIFAPLALMHVPTAWMAAPKAGPISLWPHVVFFTSRCCEGTSRTSIRVVIYTVLNDPLYSPPCRNGPRSGAPVSLRTALHSESTELLWGRNGFVVFGV